MRKSSAPAENTAAAPELRRPARGRSARPLKVDGTLLKTLKKVSSSQPLVVTMKLRPEGATFAQLPVSNDTGNARAHAFAHDVEALINSAGGEGGAVRVIQRAANVGVATVEAPASVIKRLADSAAAKLETLYLARGDTPSQL